MTEDATGADGAVKSAEVSEAVSDETAAQQAEATEDDGPKDLDVDESQDEEQTAIASCNHNDGAKAQ